MGAAGVLDPESQNYGSLVREGKFQFGIVRGLRRTRKLFLAGLT
jgi:hypothetical protein